ncbi:kinase-like domain-containing protein [Hypoxylon sp. FL1284]|nr:kinase-like domain-containing protein [Hypoxylon sp. FL1284]
MNQNIGIIVGDYLAGEVIKLKVGSSESFDDAELEQDLHGKLNPLSDKDLVVGLNGSFDALATFFWKNLNEHPEDKDFFTLRLLHKLLPAEKVEQCLAMLLIEAKKAYRPRWENVSDYLQLIYPQDEPSSLSTSTGTKSCIRLFALLGLMGTPQDVFKFIDQDICDDKLPMERDSIKQFYTNPKLQNFYEWQRRVNVPCFEYNKHQIFEEQAILPFIKGSRNQYDDQYDNADRQKTQNHLTERGGYGEVSYVEIHEECHNFHDNPISLRTPTGPFALKRLIRLGGRMTEIEFKKEAGMLEKFNGSVHHNIVSVASTYKHGKDYFLLFPWADWDLAKYCASKDPIPTMDPPKVRWLAKQCFNLVEAIHQVHDPPDPDRLQPTDKLYGRHGDIKAENILIFESKDGEPEFILADFGLGALHHDHSKSEVPNHKIQTTPGLKPPESIMEGAVITRSFDVWSLGCLFLDLLTWLLGGWQQVQVFQRSRMSPYIDGQESDIYFDMVTTETEKTVKTGCIVKKKVTEWFGGLHSHKHCTQFVHDFLDMIEEQMLIVETTERKRSRTKALLERLKTFNDGCKNEAYCVNAVPRPALSERGTPIIAEAQLSLQASIALRKSGRKLTSLHGHTEKAEQAREQDENHPQNS